MGLDPAWATVLVVGEGAALKHVTTCLRAPGRYASRHDDVEQSVEDGYSNALTPTLSTVIQRVVDVRRPERETEDGQVPAEPIEDVLASADLYDECEQLVDSLEGATAARAYVRRCVALNIAQGIALSVAMLLVPVALWPPLADGDLLSGAALHASNTILTLAVLAVVVLFVLTIFAENALDKALVRHRAHGEHIG